MWGGVGWDAVGGKLTMQKPQLWLEKFVGGGGTVDTFIAEDVSPHDMN